jgi:cytochrome c
MLHDHLIVEFAGSFAMDSSFALAGFADAENQEPSAFVIGFENVAGLAEKIGDVDGGQGIGAFEHQRIAWNEPGEYLARLERGQGTAQTAKIERLFGHGSSPACIRGWVKSARLTDAGLPAKVRQRLPLAQLARESRVMRRLAIAACFFLLLSPLAAHAQLRGHGGPVRALAISPDGKTAISGSFDQTAIVWSLGRDTAEQVLRFHEGAVNAAVMLGDGRAATAGEDGRIAIWRFGREQPDAVLEGHGAPVVALAVSPDGKRIASASWDHTVRIWPLAGGAPRVLEGHPQNVNGVAFLPDGRVVSAGYDATIRIWPAARPDEAPNIITLPTPLNAVVAAPDGEIIAGGADGRVRFLRPTGEVNSEVEAQPTPIISIAASPDGKLVAASSIRGSVAITDRASRKLARTLVGPGLPVWSLAFLPDSRTLLTGGTDRMIRRWDAQTGEPIGALALGAPEDPLAAYAGDHGAEVFRACVACHTLRPDEGNRAGPTLHGIFGRHIGGLPGYRYSEAFRHLDIVWTPETVAKLFELGPAAFTPGTKMPEQRIGSAEDRAALVDFLARATNQK